MDILTYVQLENRHLYFRIINEKSYTILINFLQNYCFSSPTLGANIVFGAQHGTNYNNISRDR